MHPASHLALRNMVLFREAWAENVQLLLSSLEALAPLTQFMSVVGRSVPKLRKPIHMFVLVDFNKKVSKFDYPH